MKEQRVDYQWLSRGPLAKRAVRAFLVLPFVNPIVVWALSVLPRTRWTARVPVLRSARLRMADAADVVLLRADRCHVARELFWADGSLESPASRLSLGLAIGLSKDADLFLDIGAYTGLFALAVARAHRGVRCDAYEIVPENFQLMWGNVIANDLVPQVHPYLVGVGAEKGTLRVQASMGPGALASSVALDAGSSDGVEVPIETLDGRYESFAGKMVVKIDVEGFEWAVLQGGRSLIGRSKPDIVCEVLRRAPNIPALQRQLVEWGYLIYHITDSGLRQASVIEPVVHERDWLFTLRSSDELAGLGFPICAAKHGSAA